MGFFDKIFGSTDPASQWKGDENIQNALDLDKPALCGIRLGDHSDRIARLGPPDNAHPSKEETYCYKKHGFVIDTEDRYVCSFTIAFDDKASNVETDIFSGTVLYKGQLLDLSVSTREEEFRKYFGDPFWRDVDEKEHLLFYEFGKVEWQVEFGIEDALSVFTIVTPPLLSDPEQRGYYKINVPWPPR